MANINIQDIAKHTIRLEAEAVRQLIDYIDEKFEAVVALVAKCPGKLVISGVGKSALIAQKIVATLNSTGTHASFLHATDAIHGDLGMVQPEDMVLLISKSGESAEIRVLLPIIKSFGNTVIAMTGNLDSFLAVSADHILNTTVKQEACPNNLAPTASTAAQLAMGDALAICLMEQKGFASEDFARFHPGGTLGKRLYLRVSDLFMKDTRPSVALDSNLKEIMVAITQNRMGATAVLDGGNISGIITDGDIRRMLQNNDHLEGLTAKDIMSRHPKYIEESQLAVAALDIMRKNSISQLLVINAGREYTGILHLHDLVREGII